MAKGIGGKTYEALVKVVLDVLLENKIIKGNIFWNQKPNEISVVPDFLVGNELVNPEYVIAVSHGDSPKESNRKCWRNISELCEMKTKLFSSPYVISIVFDSHIKKDIMELQNNAFDAQYIVGNTDYAAEVSEWVKHNMRELPKDQNLKIESIKKRRSTDIVLDGFLNKISMDLIDIIEGLTEKSTLKSLWILERSRSISPSPVAKLTCFKRGFTKRILMDDTLDKDGNIVSLENINLFYLLGLVKSTMNGYTICDNELLSFLDSPVAKNYKKISKKCMTVGFLNQLSKVKNYTMIDIGIKYVLDNYDELITPDGMKRCIVNQKINPTVDITLPQGIEEPHNIWIYDTIASLIKAAEGKSQAFGYSFFATHQLSNSSNIGSMTVGDWCSCFANEFFNRRQNIPDNALDLISIVLSEYLGHYSRERVLTLKTKIQEQYIKNEYEKTLLSHRGFSPLQQLLIDEGIIKKKTENITTCFAERAELTGNSGAVSVCKSKTGKTIIKCLSANKNPSDKRKELCGQAVGLRYSWDKERNQFVPRFGVEKLILFLDGTWKKKDLKLLIEAGWDEIYYPDEIDKLKAAIV